MSLLLIFLCFSQETKKKKEKTLSFVLLNLFVYRNTESAFIFPFLSTENSLFLPGGLSATNSLNAISTWSWVPPYLFGRDASRNSVFCILRTYPSYRSRQIRLCSEIVTYRFNLFRLDRCGVCKYYVVPANHNPSPNALA